MKLYRITLELNELAYYGEGQLIATNYIYISGYRNLGKRIAEQFEEYGKNIIVKKVEVLVPTKEAKHLCRFGGTFSTLIHSEIIVKENKNVAN